MDPRFSIAHREARLGCALAAGHFLWWFAFAYGLGSRPVAEYTYVFGLPAWFVWSCLGSFVAVMIALAWLTRFALSDMPLDDEGGA